MHKEASFLPFFLLSSLLRTVFPSPLSEVHTTQTSMSYVETKKNVWTHGEEVKKHVTVAGEEKTKSYSREKKKEAKEEA